MSRLLSAARVLSINYKKKMSVLDQVLQNVTQQSVCHEQFLFNMVSQNEIKSRL